MKNMILKCIRKYQKTPSKAHSRCKYIPTCSEYAYIAIERFGILKGSFLALKRILKCNPLSKGGIDLVPEKKGKKE